MKIAQLMASPFYGGPERQVLGMAKALRPNVNTVFYSYREGGKSADFMARASDEGFATIDLQNNWPHWLQCKRELATRLQNDNVDVLCCNGYKPDILGVVSARSIGVPCVSIAHGWTSATAKVQINEWMDKRSMRWFDRVVGVSAEQSRRVIASGVSSDRVVTIHNGIDPNAMAVANAEDRRRLESIANASIADASTNRILVAAGRLSPEKGFDVLVRAMRLVADAAPSTGLVIFGDGPLKSELSAQIDDLGLTQNVILGGFRNDLHRLIPQSDLFVMTSRTEGLPVILLEAMAAGVASVTTAVGGIGELVRNNIEGKHVPVEDAMATADAIIEVISDDEQRQSMSRSARQRIEDGFTHRHQADQFAALFQSLLTVA